MPFKSGCFVEAVTLPTHPVGKCAEFEVKSSAVCCLVYSGLWCVCAQLRGWVGWTGEYPICFKISYTTATEPEPNAGTSTAVSGRNSALSISDYPADTSGMPCPRQGLPRSRKVHACCLLSGVYDVHYSVLQNTNSRLRLGLGPKSQNHR